MFKIIGFITLIAFNIIYAVPSLINYQGRLTDLNGDALTGNKSISVSIFDAVTNGTSLYTEDVGEVALDNNGIYSFSFGTNEEDLISALQTTGEHWLELTIDGSAQTPRERVLSVPFAQVAGSLASEELEESLLDINHLISILILANSAGLGLLDNFMSESDNYYRFNHGLNIKIEGWAQGVNFDSTGYRTRSIDPPIQGAIYCDLTTTSGHEFSLLSFHYLEGGSFNGPTYESGEVRFVNPNPELSISEMRYRWGGNSGLTARFVFGLNEPIVEEFDIALEKNYQKLFLKVRGEDGFSDYLTVELNDGNDYYQILPNKVTQLDAGFQKYNKIRYTWQPTEDFVSSAMRIEESYLYFH